MRRLVSWPWSISHPITTRAGWTCRAIAVTERIALTIEQVNDSALDIARLGIAVKPSDSRSQSYVAQYGSHCWEADVLPAVVIEQALDEHIRSWINDKLWRRRDKEIEMGPQPTLKSMQLR